MKLIIYINNFDYCHNLQHKINCFNNKCKMNDMDPTKFKKITFKRKKQYINLNYNVNGTPIMDTHTIKDLNHSR